MALLGVTDGKDGVKSEFSGEFGEAGTIDDTGPHVVQTAFGGIRVASEEAIRDDESEDGVPEEFEALVVGEFRADTAMGEGKL